jgi:hypothetical protein
MHDQGTIHYSQLPPAEPGSRIAREWETYRREVGRLLAEGHEGRFLLQPYLIQQVRSREPLHRHARYGPCPT